MNDGDVTRHEVDEQRIERALGDMWGRTFDHWHDMRYGDARLRRALGELTDELLDHVAACTFEDPDLRTPAARTALLTAAECALEGLTLGCFPGGDWKVRLPLIKESLSSEEMSYSERWEPEHLTTTARTWLDAFETAVVSGLVWDWQRVTAGLLLDFATTLHEGVPYSKRESVSEPADLAQMDALCGYLYERRPALRKPSDEKRAEAARRLDAMDAPTPDQRLLRVLLDDDQRDFEQALTERLSEHREASVEADPTPRSLLPVGTIALASLAVQAHGWDLGVRSGYLPESLLSAPAG